MEKRERQERVISLGIKNEEGRFDSDQRAGGR